MKIRKLLSLSLVVTLVVLMLGSIPAMAEEPMSTEKWAEKAHKNPAGTAACSMSVSSRSKKHQNALATHWVNGQGTETRGFCQSERQEI